MYTSREEGRQERSGVVIFNSECEIMHGCSGFTQLYVCTENPKPKRSEYILLPIPKPMIKGLQAQAMTDEGTRWSEDGDWTAEDDNEGDNDSDWCMAGNPGPAPSH